MRLLEEQRNYDAASYTEEKLLLLANPKSAYLFHVRSWLHGRNRSAGVILLDLFRAFAEEKRISLTYEWAEVIFINVKF